VDTDNHSKGRRTSEPLVLRKRERFRAKENAESVYYRVRCVPRTTQQVNGEPNNVLLLRIWRSVTCVPNLGTQPI